MLRRSTASGTLAFYTACIFSSAFMLFLVEPMVAKMLLPLVGGAPTVWTAAVLFFQAGLLAGYAYAHGLARRLSSRRQAFVHLGVMLLPLLVLPIGVPLGWSLPSGGNPVPSLLLLLSLMVGLPFFVVSAGSPLLQLWFASTGHPHAADPYFLYRASNLGSFAALIAYPTLIEPHLGLIAQSRAWEAGYLTLVLMTVTCTALLWRQGAGDRMAVRESPAAGRAMVVAPPITRMRRARWVLLAAVPSLWMLAVTTYFTSTIRPMPLLWVIPLALYLLSLAIVFARRTVIPQALLARAFPFLALPLLAMVLLQGSGPFWLLAALHFGTFFVGALICHGRLAGDRPGRDALTEFYLWLAVGGAIGGLLAILAPFIFNDLTEYPLVIVLASFLRPSAARSDSPRDRLLDIVFPVAMAALLTLPILGLTATGVLDRLNRAQLTGAAQVSDLLRVLVVFAIPAVLCIAFSRRSVRFGLGTAMIFLLSFLPIGSQQSILFQTRDFFGVHTVLTDPSGSRHILMDGATIHGVQLLGSGKDEPRSYYSAQGPLGDLFASIAADDAKAHVGGIGLGAGEVACYAKPGQEWTFYEIDPAVEAIAQNPRLFSFIHDCAAGNTRIVTGDGRLSLARDARARYDVLIIDAFGGDAPPVHLLTREALQLYFNRLAPGGVVAFNVSNKYVNLTSVLANAGADLGMATYQRVDLEATPNSVAEGIFPSAWIVMARSPSDLAALISRPGWVPAQTDSSHPVWTDDFSNVLSVTVFR